jgi:hypothetical protein
MSTSNRITPQSVSKEMKKQSRDSAQEVETDFLDVDSPIPGQNFVCMSFLSPEAAIKERYLWYVKSFLQSLTEDIPKPENMPELEFKNKLQQIVTKKVSYNGISSLWEDFLYEKRETLEQQYDEKVDFQTSTRGLKIRGTYGSYREAKNRSDQISKYDKNHHVYIGQVGYWLPWDPDPHEVPEQEYQEKELNTLMKKYRENLVCKDQFFEERNREKMDSALKQNSKSKKVNEKDKKELSKVRNTVSQKDKIFNDILEANVKNKKDVKDSKIDTINNSNDNDIYDDLPDLVDVSDSESDESDTKSNVDTSNIIENTNLSASMVEETAELAANVAAVFETDDPWLQRKLEREKKL